MRIEFQPPPPAEEEKVLACVFAMMLDSVSPQGPTLHQQWRAAVVSVMPYLTFPLPHATPEVGGHCDGAKAII